MADEVVVVWLADGQVCLLAMLVMDVVGGDVGEQLSNLPRLKNARPKSGSRGRGEWEIARQTCEHSAERRGRFVEWGVESGE